MHLQEELQLLGRDGEVRSGELIGRIPDTIREGEERVCECERMGGCYYRCAVLGCLLCLLPAERPKLAPLLYNRVEEAQPKV